LRESQYNLRERTIFYLSEKQTEFFERTVKASTKCLTKHVRSCILNSVNQLIDYCSKGGTQMGANGLSFGKYIESIRTSRRKSLRETAKAIGVSPQFYSEVEKDRRCAFTADRLELLKKFLEMSTEEAEEMNNKAAESYKGKNVAVPQDFADYIVERDYVMSALRTMKEMDADEVDWKKMVDEFVASKKGEGQ